ncbi:MAG: hypothetical protein AAF699_00005 [Pseudomonadota bacterium]
MDVLLIILGVLGFGAIIISAYVFTVAARNYVSTDDPPLAQQTPTRKEGFVTRNPHDRRKNPATEFPITVNSVVIEKDRRRTPERRVAA